MEETNDHYLILCEFEKEVWASIFSWCNLKYFQISKAEEVLSIMLSKFHMSITKKLVHTVFLVTIRLLWKSRSMQLFNGKVVSATWVINEIKVMALLWIKNRGRLLLVTTATYMFPFFSCYSWEGGVQNTFLVSLGDILSYNMVVMYEFWMCFIFFFVDYII